MKPKRVIAINPYTHKIYETTVRSLEDMQFLVGGYIERAHLLDNGDEVYVNEEGLFEQHPPLFYINGAPQPYAGKAFILGAVTSTGDNRAAKSRLTDIICDVQWLTPARSEEEV